MVSSFRSLLVLLVVSLICSVLVSIAAVTLRPIQQQNELIERYRNVVRLTGLTEPGVPLSDEDILDVVAQLDVRVVNLETGGFEPEISPDSVDSRAAVRDPELSVVLAAEHDLAGLGRRAVHEVIFLVWDEEDLERVILPIHGQGMWSTLSGLIALEADLNTIAAVVFYEQAETAGLGDQIERPQWQARWSGRRLLDRTGNVRFRVASGAVADGAPGASHEVDGLSGATVTANAVTDLVRFWFGDLGYGRLLARMTAAPLERAG